MSEPTAGERALATRFGVKAAVVAAAREVINTIGSLPWPRSERVALLVRFARAGRADVGEVLGGLAIDAAPLAGLDALVPIRGLGHKRVAGLARALAAVDVTQFSSEGVRLREAWAAIAALRVENQALRVEVDRLKAGAQTGNGQGTVSPGPAVMRIADVASSVGSQLALVDDLLRSRPHGLRLGGLDVRLQGKGAAADGDVALDLGSPGGGSAVGISFVPGSGEASRDTESEVPDVSGYTTALAERKLLARGFAVAFATLAGARGIVREQSPAPHTLAPAGSLVRLIVR